MSYPDRLATFHGLWDDNRATATQLAATGHISDRPPLEALEEGSRCVSCSNFVRRELSICALEGSVGTSSAAHEHAFGSFTLHHPGCIRLQVRIPLDLQATIGGSHGGYRMQDMKSRWERRIAAHQAAPPRTQRPQTSSLFSLPTELRLEIYRHILPSLDSVTEIVPLNRDSARVVTKAGQEKTGPRDLSKTNILRTCKAIHHEALDMLFATTTYQFGSTKLLYLFLRHVGSPGRSLLTSVDVYCGSREDAITFALLATCSKLRRITIRFPRPTITFPGSRIWIMDGMACLLTLSGLEDVKFGDCGANFPMYMNESKPDAAIIRRELTRPRGAAGGVRWVDGYLDV
ncbi:hypothetical protein LTR36_010114 [Oleoguttula mirabilis]|uniref:F-box domain-containing protein n=1 Tax=Oleoguttula mirabilis TaxID=1507867 RepID=A0AAV9JS33_9PEZI|nr:hypothetical protein LTR36_010114 [Oleoguttula mirabilis]